MEDNQILLKINRSTKSGNFITNWLRKISLKQKFSIIIGLIVLVLVFGAFNFWFAMRLSTGIRTYVNAESLYSKGQKDAYNSLLKYYISFDENEYEKFLMLLDRHPLAAMRFRIEINKDNYDYYYLKAQTDMEGIHPEDLGYMIWLYKNFGNLSYIKEAVVIWEKTDNKVVELKQAGEKINKLINTSYDLSNPEEVEKRKVELEALKKDADVINDQLDILEKDFSGVLAKASRLVSDVLPVVSLIFSITLGIFTVIVSLLITSVGIQVEKVKDEFISLVSHQLRTPATTVKWYTTTLLNEKKDLIPQEAVKYLKEIYYGNERIIALINVMLGVAHVELGKIKMNIVKVEPKILLDKIVENQELEALKKNQKIITEQIGNIQGIYTDRVLLTTILESIISNALKYTREGGTINCTVKMLDDNVLFAIKDNGIGIPEKNKQRIFEKLYRAENAINYSTDGNGLGLYVVKSIIKVMKGKVWFDSLENQGTTFFVKIPIRPVSVNKL